MNVNNAWSVLRRFRPESSEIKIEFVTSLKSNDFFVVSYPRSGVHWVCLLLGNYLGLQYDKERIQPGLKSLKYIVDINHEYFNDKLVHFAQLPTLPNRFFRVHAPYNKLFRNRRIVLVVRDPRDVMVSYYHYQSLKGQITEQVTIDEFVRAKKHWPVPWKRHVSGWLNARKTRVMIVRYEDLHADT